MKNILVKYNLVIILPFKNTFFYTANLPRNIQLSKELLKINYLKYSPKKDSNVIGYIKEKHLMLWFYTQDIKAPIIIPESFLLYQELKKQNEDAIYIIEDAIYKIIIIKNNYLVSAFSMKTMDEQILELSSDEFGINKKITINKKKYKILYKNALKSLPLKELFYFNQLDLEPKKVAKVLFDYTAYPLSALIVFIIIANYMHTSYLKSQIENLKSDYIMQRNKNREISKEIRKHNNEVKKWKNFVQKELLYTDPISLLDSVYKIIKSAEKVTIKEISINSPEMILRLQTNLNPVLFLNRLSKNRYIKNVIIQNTYKPRKEDKIITYAISLKPLEDM